MVGTLMHGKKVSYNGGVLHDENSDSKGVFFYWCLWVLKVLLVSHDLILMHDLKFEYSMMFSVHRCDDINRLMSFLMYGLEQ